MRSTVRSRLSLQTQVLSPLSARSKLRGQDKASRRRSSKRGYMVCNIRFRNYFIVLAFLMSAALCASADILKIKIDGPIHAITEEHVQRALDLAKQQNADAVLIEIRTPGGLADATHNIVEK